MDGNLTRTQRFTLGKVARDSVQGKGVTCTGCYADTMSDLAGAGLLIQGRSGLLYLTDTGAQTILAWPRGARPVKKDVLKAYIQAYPALERLLDAQAEVQAGGGR